MTRVAPVPETVTLHVPFRVVKRGGRKETQLPEGAIQPQRVVSMLVKALARAFRWKRMLESGEFATIAELAEREGIARSWMIRVLRLTLLARTSSRRSRTRRRGRMSRWCGSRNRFLWGGLCSDNPSRDRRDRH